MDRSQSFFARRPAWYVAFLAVTMLLPSTGCLHQLIATGIYIMDGGNLVDANSESLEDMKVVVFCRPPSSSEYTHAGASRDLAKRITAILAENVPGVRMVDSREVDEWLDENDSDDYEALAQAVGAERVLRIELDHFDLYKGKTLYQGNADITITVYDMVEGGQLLYEEDLGEVLFPVNSGIPAQDKPVRQFQKEFVQVLSETIAMHFYRHDPHAHWAIDSEANR